MAISDVLERLATLGLEPGDVIVTGNHDPVSAAIQRATGSQVSHVMVCVGDGMIVEATEYRNLADDRHGGVYLRPLSEVIAGKYVDRIVVRRPATVRHDIVVAAARRFLDDQPVFSSSGIVFTGLLVGLGQFWTERAADLMLGEDRADELERRFADIVADGTKRIICAELVYRILHEAHVPLAHDGLFLQDAIRHVRPLDPLADAIGSLSDGSPPALGSVERLALALEEADRLPEAPDSESAIDRLGWPMFLRLTSRHVRRAYQQRRDELDDGDIADLITPRDFLAMRPFDDLLDLRLSRPGR